MILVDDRIGSADMAAPLSMLGHPVEVARLEFGDVVFAGHGANGTTVQVAVEIKRLPDLLNSFASGRFNNHQLPGLTSNYDQVWLVIEGRYRGSFAGVLEWARETPLRDGVTMSTWSDAGYGFRRWMYRELEGRLSTLQIKAGIKVARTSTSDETARFIGALYDWWTSGEYAEHRSHEASLLKAQMPLLRPPTLKERIACQLPHLGASKASMAAGAFESVQQMINAPAEVWMRMPGIGKKVARDIVAAIGER